MADIDQQPHAQVIDTERKQACPDEFDKFLPQHGRRKAFAFEHKQFIGDKRKKDGENPRENICRLPRPTHGTVCNLERYDVDERGAHAEDDVKDHFRRRHEAPELFN